MAGKALGAMATVVAAAAMGLAACGGEDEPTTYTPEIRENFVTSCVDSATSTDSGAPAPEADAQRICGCMYDELKARMSFDEFLTADESLRNGEDVSADLQATLQAAAANCT